ncbi:MAG: hypothetical protein EXS27_11680, partial [Pedosphaera sp.]|nr:hypothetical protein [Pedosphaera sp.]
VYVGDYFNDRIRKINPAGVVTTLAGSSRGSVNGTGTAAQFNQPHGVAVDGAGNVYVADSSNQRIRKITPAGVVTTLAGSSGGFADGTGTAAQFANPYGVAVDGAGNVYVADQLNNRIRKITPAGEVTTLAGGSQGFADGTGTAAQFANPFGVAVDGAGNVYVADELNHRIRKIITSGGLPTITTQPLPQTVAIGSSATFTVTVTDTNGVSYQWRKEGFPIAGATNDFLTLSNIQPAGAGSYDVTVSNAAGTTTSSSASLSIVGAPTITTQPSSRTVTQGSTVNFTVGIATSATLPLRYQWRHNGIDIPGAINPVFTLANAQSSAAGLYSVLVANSVGTILSAEAALFVISPPMVVTHPTNQSVTLGSNVTFTVVASGGTPLTYQWRVNGAPIPGANNQSLTITGAQLSSAGIYDVLVSDGTFSVFSSSAVLTVLPPFAITPQPVGKATNVGGSATFTAGAVGFGVFAGPFTYQWTFNGAPLAGQTGPSLAFTGLALVNSGNYACVVDSPLGAITSSSALLTVFNPFSVGATSFQPGGLFQMTASGDNGRAYRLESSTNLLIWAAVVTNTVSGGTATFTDNTAAGKVLRFYRIVLLP